MHHLNLQHRIAHTILPDCSFPVVFYDIMPVNGYNTIVDQASAVVSTSTVMATSSNCSSPSPTNSLPHVVQHNGGQMMDIDSCINLVSSKNSTTTTGIIGTSSRDNNLTTETFMDDFSNHLSLSPKQTFVADREKVEMTKTLSMFECWSFNRQTEFVEQLIGRMSFHQHEHLYSILIPMLQRDFIKALPSE